MEEFLKNIDRKVVPSLSPICRVVRTPTLSFANHPSSGARFPGLNSLTLKANPHFANFNLVTYDRGGFVYPLKSLILVSCKDLSTDGLAAIAANCFRFLFFLSSFDQGF
ncbi:hypothetical protein V6N12_062269 [Hibiscus sabdariffa]|uniref:Transport inhibitor response 1 domain-containing protein n=1 Tax=Hibiscus sabdariffa TaxID=183260 RepID=A0ABR2F8F1_9ROSI